MKIILSRKGFDSSSGGIASPILPDGRLLSLPIPVTQKQKSKGERGIAYSDLRFDGLPISRIINDLYISPRRQQFPYKEAHLDPDLDPDRLENRGEGWKRTFGQQGNAQVYLRKRGVDKGDLFLFFGWFRHTYQNGGLHYVKHNKEGDDLHVISGWLHVGEIREVPKNQDLGKIPNWLHYHPHVVNRRRYTNNTIYIAAEHLTLDGLSVQGAGTFPCFKPSLQLTGPEEKSRSLWCLPKWLCRGYIEGKWKCHKDHLPFDSDGRRQEFVFEVPDCQVTIDWIRSLFDCG